jgi:hypothetical protein
MKLEPGSRFMFCRCKLSRKEARQAAQDKIAEELVECIQASAGSWLGKPTTTQTEITILFSKELTPDLLELVSEALSGLLNLVNTGYLMIDRQVVFDADGEEVPDA